MLAQMFRPRIYKKYFQVAIWILEIAKDSPLVSAVTTSNAFVFIDGGGKPGCLFLVNGILNHHHDRAGVRRRRILIHDGGQPPMNPGREIDGCVRQLQQ